MSNIRAVSVVALAAAIFVLGLAAGKFLQRIDLHLLARSIERDIAILSVGGDKYSATKREEEYRNVGRPQAAAGRTVNTSRLPISLKEMPLAKAGAFPSGGGGAITNVEGTLFAIDRLGDIFAYRNGTLRKMDYGTFPNDLTDFIENSPDALNGLSVLNAHHIAYDKARGTIYATLERFNRATNKTRFNVSAISIDKRTFERAGSWRTVFETEDMTHERLGGATGGKLIVSGDTLYFAIGNYDVGQVPRREAQLAAQNPKSSFGKIFEHDLITGKTKVRSIGHRNPEGLVFTRDGRLIDAEHGPEGGDELNVIVDGANYGWPYRTYGTDYGTFDWPITFKEPAGVTFAEPLYAWVPSPAISSVIQVSSFNDRWNGDLLVGSLKAQSLFRVRLLDDRVAFSEPIWIGRRIRDIAEVGAEIVLLTDEPSLIFVSVDRERLEANRHLQALIEMNPKLRQCMTCHHFGETDPSQVAPTLANIVNKPIASDNFEHYSEALKQKGGTWDEASLIEFIRDPGAFAPGSAMPRLGLSERDAQEIVALLAN